MFGSESQKSTKQIGCEFSMIFANVHFMIICEQLAKRQHRIIVEFTGSKIRMQKLILINFSVPM
jgi:hypothetical protein